MSRVLIADDEEKIRRVVGAFLQDRGYDVKEADCGRTAVRVAGDFQPQVILMDLSMPDINGIETMNQILQFLPGCKMIFITAYGSIESAVAAMGKGAFDYITKPFRNDDLLLRIQKAFKVAELEERVERLEDQLTDRYSFSNIIGDSVPMKQVLELVRKVMGKDTTVFITGETGTGKELIARTIHHHSPRRGGKFVAINCAAIPETLVEDELFGHEKGAYTGASSKRMGRFEEADGGTLLLDEVCELSPPAQPKLLRVLQEREITRIGGTGTVPVDVRVICATSRDLLEWVKAGKFMEELYYRLNVFPIRLPPLRERKEDISALVDYFIPKFKRTLGTSVVGIADDAMEMLKSYNWPGNVRELENAVQHSMLMAEGTVIEPEHLPLKIQGVPESRGKKEQITLAEMLSEVERRTILRVLGEEGGNRTRAARRLGISRQTLITKIQAYEIK
ncbi:MAG: sigma-54-dependent Fis family transcriptional regulator [Candidatus Latescibacteria bacterium]|nr:sigma-54-dependent Fis family transcriptional regulator [Candidatus Latescibacterota bacterium]